MDVAFAFAALGGIIIIGFLAALAFEKTKIPDIVVLIIIGLVFGPIAVTFFNIEFVSPYALATIAPYFTSLALIIILFDGGLNLNFERVLSTIGMTVAYAAVGFGLSMFMITAVSMLIFGYPFIISLLLGAILGGTSSAVVLGLIRRMKVSEETRSLLSLESVISDVLCVVLVLSLIQFMTGEGTGAIVAASVVKSFSIAIVAGLVFGIIWLRTLKVFQGKPFSFMITIAALLILYSGVEIVEGSGFVAALIFGLVLGNKEEVARMFRIKSELVFDERIKTFHSEVSFFIKTAFFVFLGLSFTLNIQDIGIRSSIPFFQTGSGPLILFSIGIVVISILLLVARYINTKVTLMRAKEFETDTSVLSLMSARGLTAAALASLPFTIAAYTTNTSYHNLLEPYRTGFLNITFLVILITVGITSVSIYLIERKRENLTIEEIEAQVVKVKYEREEKKKWRKEERDKRREKIKSEDRKKKDAKRLSDYQKLEPDIDRELDEY